MTEREKLINLLSTAGWNLFTDTQSKEQIADYLLANGVIILPVKIGDTVSETVETINNVYEQLEEQIQSLKTKCEYLQVKLNDQYANDKEIVRLQEIIDEQDSELRYGFGITKEENEIITEWIKKHNLKEHGSETVYYGAIGGGMTYIFIPTSVGTVCKVRCSCGEEFCFRDL